VDKVIAKIVRLTFLAHPIVVDLQQQQHVFIN